MKNYIYIIISCLLCSNPIWADRQSNVQTPKGSSVEAWILDEMSNDDILMWNSHFTSRYPAAEMLAPSTNAYNCHGYAWHMSEGGDARWIGKDRTTDEDIYMSDGSYIEVPAGTSLRKVSYQNADHSAITTGQSNMLISKWSYGPLMRHAPDDSPFTYSSLRYYIKYTEFSEGWTEFICNGSPVTYTLKYTPIGSINWIVPNGLRIISGQGTTSITVEATNTTCSEGVIKAQIGNKEMTHNVIINGINVTSIIGSSRPQLNSAQIYNANTNTSYWPQGLTWNWDIATSVYPKPSYTFTNSQMRVTFTHTGSYTLRCWISSPCNTSVGTGYLYVTVGAYYLVQLDPQTGYLQIRSTEAMANNKSRKTTTCIYELINATTGKIVSKGSFNSSEGLSTYINNLSKNIYALMITESSGINEVHKLSY